MAIRLFSLNSPFQVAAVQDKTFSFLCVLFQVSLVIILRHGTQGYIRDHVSDNSTRHMKQAGNENEMTTLS